MTTETALICLSALIVFLGLALFASAIRVAPEYQRLVVFRLGRCIGVTGPGLVFLLPTIDRGIGVDLREQKREYTGQAFHSSDQIVSPADSVLKVGNFEVALQSAVATALSQEVERLDARDIVHAPERLRQKCFTRLEESIQPWGARLIRLQMTVGEVAALPEALAPIPKAVSQSNSPLIGKSGETISTIYTEGMVVDGSETWPAVSKHPIPPGKPVRVARVVLEVDELESGSAGMKT